MLLAAPKRGDPLGFGGGFQNPKRGWKWAIFFLKCAFSLGLAFGRLLGYEV